MASASGDEPHLEVRLAGWIPRHRGRKPLVVVAVELPDRDARIRVCHVVTPIYVPALP